MVFTRAREVPKKAAFIGIVLIANGIRGEKWANRGSDGRTFLRCQSIQLRPDGKCGDMQEIPESMSVHNQVLPHLPSQSELPDNTILFSPRRTTVPPCQGKQTNYLRDNIYAPDYAVTRDSATSSRSNAKWPFCSSSSCSEYRVGQHLIFYRRVF